MILRQGITPGEIAASLAGARRMTWLARLPLWRGAVVLAYHRMYRDGEETAFDPGALSATQACLADQLEFLTRHFEVVTPQALVEESGSPRRRVLLTFDDGYRDNFELAFPVLRAYGVSAAFFLTTGRLDHPDVAWWDELAWIVKQSPREAIEPGRWLSEPLRLDGDRRFAIAELTRVFKTLPSDQTEQFLDFCAEAAGSGRCTPSAGADLWMTWEMAREMLEGGMTIGGHTASHPVLARARPEVQAVEIEECARRLHDELGVRMSFFAYPVGLPSTFDGVTREILRRAGVKLAFSLYGGYARPRRVDQYDFPRSSVSAELTPQRFRAMLELPGLFARW